MKKIMFSAVMAFALAFLASQPLRADDSSRSTRYSTARDEQPASGSNSGMVEDKDGDLKNGEYEVISMNGSITRSFCPYTCEMRGIPRAHCKTWRSMQDPDKCYVQDTSIPSNAITWNK